MAAISTNLASAIHHKDMANRRIPLQSIPNAVNSPQRPTLAPGTKRGRIHVEDHKGHAYYEQQPPAKRLQLDRDERDPQRAAALRKIASTRHERVKSMPFPTQKLQSTQSHATAEHERGRSEKSKEAAAANLESIRQWQKHYRKLFPSLVFYFEGIPDDVKRQSSRQVQALGAKEELFFSRAVTHVVTNRAVPHDSASVSSESTEGDRHASSRYELQSNGKTINPLLLDTQQLRGRAVFDQIALQKKGLSHNDALRRPGQADILQKAKQLNMKVWTLEKLERMMKTMFETVTGENAVLPPERVKDASRRRTARNADLSHLLQQEKLQNNINQDWMHDMLPFKGCYVYVHDMDEKTKPVMLRDYAKPATREAGKWPQLRLTDPGRCPFLDEPMRSKTAQAAADTRPKAAPRTRAVAREEKMGHALQENPNLARRAPPTNTTANQEEDELAKPLDPPKSIPIKRGSTDNLPHLYGSAQASLRQMPRYAGGEPIASGVQPSHITSAIRSQMISSTAAQPGQKAGTSREMHALQRRVFEKSNLGTVSNSNAPTSYLKDARAGLNNDNGVVTRARQRNAEVIQEEEFILTEPEEPQQKKITIERKRRAEKRDPKPGYCENCRAKFEDFEQHILSKSHRKFATTADNWADLDDLLKDLVRPLKPEYRAMYAPQRPSQLI